MKFDANDYLKRMLESKEGMNEDLVKSYLFVLRNFILKEKDILKYNDNNMSIRLEYLPEENDNLYDKKLFVTVDKNNNLTIKVLVRSRENRIEWNIGFDSKHYEISIFNNLDSQDNHDMYSGVYYINKDTSGITQKFYAYDAYKYLNEYHNSNYAELFFYNSNHFYFNGFNPDYQLVQESNNQISEEQIAKELNDIIHNITVDYSLNLFKKVLSDYKQSEPEVCLILK